ncbi:MAG: hypothetical protein WEA77_12950, partial [Hyphomonas sp.]|uniref:hypothetical protein n=1 Tax=Hyphomonas sp. TaxID=87 RepID=UPI0034A02A09
VYLFPPLDVPHPAALRAVEIFNKAYPDHRVTLPERGALVAATVDGAPVHTVTARRPAAQTYLVTFRRALQAR